MQFLTFALLFLYHSFAVATPLDYENGEKQVRDLSPENSPRNGPYANLERRQTTIPNLVPTTTVKLSTGSAGTAVQTTNTNPFAVMGSHRATATSSSIAPSSTGGSPAAQSTSSKGGASRSTALPIGGILLLGLLGL